MSGATRDRIGRVLIILAYLSLFFLCIELFYRQSIAYHGVYHSDLVLHLQYALDEKITNYSLVALVLKLLYNINGTTFYIAVFLSSMVVGAIYLTFRLIKYLMPQLSVFFVQILAFALNFVTPLYLPSFNDNRYLGLISGTIWHNPTYIAMKLLAIAVLLVFLRIYLEKEPSKMYNWALLTTLLTLVTIVKPNFVLAFAPAVGCLALIDLIQKNIKWRTVLALAGSFLPAGLVLLLQHHVLYSHNDGSGFGFAFGYIIGYYAQNPYIAVLQSVAFPIMVLAANVKSIVKDKTYLFGWIMWIIAMLQYLCIIETGERMLHGNWGWGILFATFFLFFVSFIKLMQNILEMKSISTILNNSENAMMTIRRAGHEKIRLKCVYLGLSSFMLVLHFYFGIRWLLIISHGGSYV